MQIPVLSSAAQAASIAAQSTSKDKVAETQSAVAASPASNEGSVERTGESNPDRDAQGQGDGLPGKTKRARDEVQLESLDDGPQTPMPAPTLPDEPPSQLDIVG